MSEAMDTFLNEPRDCTKAELEEVFWEAVPGSIDDVVNHGGREVNLETREVYNDEYWRGFFPADHTLSRLNRLAPIPAGFRKQFWTDRDQYLGETTDADGIVTGNNVLRELHHDGRRYTVLKYSDLRYRPFYDLLVPVNDELLVGKAYFGYVPYGFELLTFGMTRRYGFDFMTPADHGSLFADGETPDPDVLEGKWDVHLVSNGGLMDPVFEFTFEQTDHGMDGEYRVLDKASGGVRLEFVEEEMRMFDFSNWHDRIRQLTDDLMVGKYCQTELQFLPSPGAGSLGHIHAETWDEGDERLCFYFVMNAQDSSDG